MSNLTTPGCVLYMHDCDAAAALAIELFVLPAGLWPLLTVRRSDIYWIPCPHCSADALDRLSARQQFQYCTPVLHKLDKTLNTGLLGWDRP